MELIEQNILDIDSGYIFHQVNCQGVMGSGLAKQIKNKWPKAYQDYRNHFIEYENNFGKDRASIARLGTFATSKVSDNIVVVHVFGQLHYGYDGKRYTDYGAVKSALWSFLEDDRELNWNCAYFPYLFGCGLGGGDWPTMLQIIDFCFPQAIICKYQKK